MNKSALANAIPRKPLRGFFGGIILRADDLQSEESLRIFFLVSKTRFNPTAKKTWLSVLTEAPMANHHTMSNGYHLGTMVHRSEAAFAIFAFDLIALLDGTYENGRISSRHCISGVIANGKEKSLNSE